MALPDFDKHPTKLVTTYVMTHHAVVWNHSKGKSGILDSHGRNASMILREGIVTCDCLDHSLQLSSSR